MPYESNIDSIVKPRHHLRSGGGPLPDDADCCPPPLAGITSIANARMAAICDHIGGFSPQQAKSTLNYFLGSLEMIRVSVQIVQALERSALYGEGMS